MDRHDQETQGPTLDPAVWSQAQSGLAGPLARAAMAVGRLDEALAAMDGAARAGAIRRLALAEVEALLWAQGRPLRREEIGRELMDARAGTDLDAMRLARWAVRRLEGQGALADLRGFLALHRTGTSDGAPTLRPSGGDFDGAALDFAGALDALALLHPLARGPVAAIAWRQAGLSPADDLAELACWTMRSMAVECEGLCFVPMGRQGRQVWLGSGAPDMRLARHLRILTDAATGARRMLGAVAAWRQRALAEATLIKGGNALRVVEVLAAHPLMTTAMVEDAAGISRATSERLLARLRDRGVLREITGTRRFRLWTAAS